MQFLGLLQQQKVSLWLSSLSIAFRECYDCFSSEFIESTLLPKLYQALRLKPAGMEQLVEAVVRLVTREGNSTLMNAYTSKISV
jgi:hypothetical protein